MREEEKQLDLFSESETRIFEVEFFVKLLKKVHFHKVVTAFKRIIKALKRDY